MNSKSKSKKKSGKKHEFNLKLSDTAFEKLYKKAGLTGIDPEVILENFIEDFVHGDYSNGSDERMYLEQWYKRSDFNKSNKKTFLKYLLENEMLLGSEDMPKELIHWEKEISYYEESIIKIQEELKSGIIEGHDGTTYTWQSIQNGNGEPSYTSKEDWEKAERECMTEYREEVDCYKKQMQDLWNDFIEWTDQKDVLLDKELKKIKKWYKKLNG